MAERLKVYIRIRPSTNDKSDDNSSDDAPWCSFDYNFGANQFRLKKKVYTINAVLPPSTQQTDVYHSVATDQINSFLQGFNTTIFAYGQTGSGKTHTIFGPDASDIMRSRSVKSSPVKRKNTEPSTNVASLYGLVPRSFITIFEQLQSSNHIKKHQLDLSCVEVYNVNYFHILHIKIAFCPNTDHTARFIATFKQQKIENQRGHQIKKVLCRTPEG